MKANFPYLKGGFAQFKWGEIETKADTYTWSGTNSFDQTMNNLASANFKICLILYTGPAAPVWLYRQPYLVDSLVSDAGDVYPDYLSTAMYQTRWRKFLDAVFAHIKTMSTTVQNNIVIYNSAEGSTGDESPFHDTRLNALNQPVAWPYTSSNPAWMAFHDTAWAWTNRELKSYFPAFSNASGSSVTLLVNPGNDSAQVSTYTSFLFGDTLNRRLNHTWLKAGNAGHGYQLNGEVANKSQYDPYINTITPANSGRTQVRSRSEMDEFYGWFTQMPKWSYYWQAINALHFGLDCWMNNFSAMADTNYNYAFPMFARYAGLKDPSKTSKGFCTLRDGLDASDFTRFPAATYGTGTIDDYSDATAGSRANKIVAAFAAYGASQQDDTAADGAPMKQRRSDSLNDAGWGIFPGNYEKFINQVNLPAANTIYRGGYWRAGPFDDSGKPKDPYGRFAKGFDSVHAITNLYFDINDALAIDSSGWGGHNAMIRITYLDSGTKNKWNLLYWTKASASAPLVQVTKPITNTNPAGVVSWKVDTTLVTNLWTRTAVTGTQADLQLQKGSKGARQPFHLIEISNQPAYPNFSKAPPEAKVTPIADQNTKLVLYPTPSKGRFMARWDNRQPGASLVRVVNSNGTEVFTQSSTTGSVQVNIQHQPAGTYYIEVHAGKEVLHTTFIKE